jgi:malate dehydrogenase (oxaloacetate-decarboxylating)
VVIFGAGTAGIGIADHIRDAMVHEGLSKHDAIGRIWCVDLPGLLTDDMSGMLDTCQATYARPDAEVKGWLRHGTAIGLAEVVHRVRPTMLIGASTSPGAFTRAIVQEMAAHTERPIIFPLSSPAPLAEATPADLIDWTGGRALIATGCSFGPVTHKGITYVIGQANNAMLYPGLGLGAIVSRARRISNGMFAAAANAISSLVAVRLPGASLLPHVDNLRNVSMTVALAVAEAALEEGLAGIELSDIEQQVQDAVWQPEYCRLRAS